MAEFGGSTAFGLTAMPLTTTYIYGKRAAAARIGGGGVTHVMLGTANAFVASIGVLQSNLLYFNMRQCVAGESVDAVGQVCRLCSPGR